MSEREMLNDFISDEFFNTPVTLITRQIDRVKGRTEIIGTTQTIINGVIQAVKEKQLKNMGLGQYTDQLAYSLFTNVDIDQSENNFIQYEGKLFKIRKAWPWKGYGFTKYIICQYNDEVLNDN